MSTRSIDKKSIAKSLYMDGNYTQEEIADKVGTTRQTVSRWIKAESWDTLKASLSITPAQIISQWNRQIVEINKKINERPEGERFANTKEADALSKLAGAIKKLEADIGVPDCVSVAMRFLSWLRPLDIEAAKQFNNLFDAFIKDQANKSKS
ncbi:MAG: helix-turn-helix domain-containing protein [Prevotella sp.]|jgi:putative ATPase subunit of terminase (gpP-like)|uniref:Putative transcription regulator n=2 Tax=unclassified Caudoviricetes TaxID=2788787 RepID=A0A8S5PSY4_9CAUD|nr:helix-turn-helix domain-containing protein [Prevotella sp.]DAE09994.1 MAG TPA: putative transcription regulator [Siphoviridae sp. ctL1i33]DAE12067.1 MAG TPA: putative transcription regulator [Siphoviridae sp. ctwIe6]